MPPKYLPLDIFQVTPPPKINKIDHHPDMFDLNQGSCVVHLGKSKAGKGVTILNILKAPQFAVMEKLELCYLYSPTAKGGDPTFRHLVEEIPDQIFGTYSDAHLQSILDAQLAIPKDRRPSIILIFDDIAGLPNINKNSLLWKLATCYRHYNIKCLYYMVQMYKQLPPIVRANMDYLLISRCTNAKEVQNMSDEVSSKFDGDKQFRKLLAQATKEPYHFLYLRLNDVPCKAFECFNKHIYTSTELGCLSVDFESTNIKSVDDEKRKREKSKESMD